MMIKNTLKKLLFCFSSLIFVLPLFAQETSIDEEEYQGNYLKSKELKLNLLYIPWGYTEISYEQLFNDHDTSFGLSVGKSLFNKDGTDIRLTLIPHYRVYFGKKDCAGFFLEASAVYLRDKDGYRRAEINTAFGSGFALGGKLIRDDGFTVEFFAGIGRILFANNSVWDEGYPRIGIMIGKRIW